MRVLAMQMAYKAIFVHLTLLHSFGQHLDLIPSIPALRKACFHWRKKKKIAKYSKRLGGMVKIGHSKEEATSGTCIRCQMARAVPPNPLILSMKSVGAEKCSDH